MKTKYLDNEIELLNSIKRNNEISDYGQEKLNEFIAIKKQLLLHNVSQQRELLLAFIKFCHSDAYSPEKTTFKEDVDAFMKANNCG